MPIIVNEAVVNPPDPTEEESDDGVLHVWTDPAYGGIKIRSRFGVIGLDPDHVVIIRVDDTPVRGADPAQAIGGVSHGYDHEAPLGAPATYKAFAYDKDDNLIGQSGTVAIMIPEPTGFYDLWVKSINDPGLSLLMSARIEAPEIGTTARLGLTAAQGARYVGGSYDRRLPTPFDLTIRLPTIGQRRQFYALIDSGELFVQLRNAYGEPDFYALAGDASHRVFLTMNDPRRDVSITLNPIDRPPTVDSSEMIPSYSIADSRRAAPTIAQARALWPTVGQAAGFPDA